MARSCKFMKMAETLKCIYAFEAFLAKKHQLLLNEAIVLCILEEGRARRSTDLANELGVTYSMMSRTLSALERHAFIDRAIGTEDKREMHFTITKNGKKMVKELGDGFDFGEFMALFGKKNGE